MSAGYLDKTPDKTKQAPYVDKLDPWSSHSRIKNWLKDFEPGTRVLDVGAATGIIGRICKALGLRMTGIEPNAVWAMAARHHYEKVIITTVDKVPEEELSGYEVVILADVLEHMPNPKEVLANLVRLQSPNTLFIISVPNVANLYVRVSLLFGRFNYSERGILDRTHLKFFTRSSLLAMLKESGIIADQVVTTPIPLSLVHPAFDHSIVGRFLFRCLAGFTSAFPTLLGYQFVVKGRVNHDQ